VLFLKAEFNFPFLYLKISYFSLVVSFWIFFFLLVNENKSQIEAGWCLFFFLIRQFELKKKHDQKNYIQQNSKNIVNHSFLNQTYIHMAATPPPLIEQLVVMGVDTTKECNKINGLVLYFFFFHLDEKIWF